MLELKFIRENPDVVKEAIRKRNLKLDLTNLIALDTRRRRALSELEELRAKKNIANEEISRLLKEKKGPGEKIASMKEIAEQIDKLGEELKNLEPVINRILFSIPNIPHASIPVGDASSNKIVRSWGEPKKPH